MLKINTRKLKKYTSLTLYITFQILIMFPLLSNYNVAHAAKLGDGTWSQGGAPGTTTITFTNTGALVAGDEVVLTFPSAEATIDGSGTNIAMTNQTTPTRTNNTTDNTITITTGTDYKNAKPLKERIEKARID